jgi:hypothetical protein
MIEVIFHRFKCGGCIGTPLGNGKIFMLTTCEGGLAIRNANPIEDEPEVPIEEIEEILKDINAKVNIFDDLKNLLRVMVDRKD